MRHKMIALDSHRVTFDHNGDVLSFRRDADWLGDGRRQLGLSLDLDGVGCHLQDMGCFGRAPLQSAILCFYRRVERAF